VRGVFVAIVIGVSAVSLATAGPAYADPNDQHFLEVLEPNLQSTQAVVLVTAAEVAYCP
jgi:hypothetical protein